MSTHHRSESDIMAAARAAFPNLSDAHLQPFVTAELQASQRAHSSQPALCAECGEYAPEPGKTRCSDCLPGGYRYRAAQASDSTYHVLDGLPTVPASQELPYDNARYGPRLPGSNRPVDTYLTSAGERAWFADHFGAQALADATAERDSARRMSGLAGYISGATR
jgi:hypothetical protein